MDEAVFETYHVMNPHDDGISMDTYVDWLDRRRLPDHPGARVCGLAGTVRDVAASTAREATPGISVAAAAQLSAARTPDQRVYGADGSIPGRSAGRTRSDRTKTSRTSPRQ